MEKKEAHVALLSGVGKGHVIPMAALAKHLHHHYPTNLTITLITQPTTSSSSSQSQPPILKSLPKSITIISLPPVPTDIFPESTNPATRSILASLHNLPHLRQLLKSYSSPPAALIVDIFGFSALDIARELGVHLYAFNTSSSLSLAVSYSALALDSTTEGEFRDMVEPVRVPGCVPVPGMDLPEPFTSRGSKTYKSYLRMLETFYEADGILMNSSEELESGAIEALKANEKLPSIYPVGPLVWTSGESCRESECVGWLDEQPRRSVIYVSFGSGGTLTRQQTEELALGLELSGHRFLWIVKNPNESEASGTYFGSGGESRGSLDFLPDGFLERTKGVGRVVQEWVPQVEVLGHLATGGFVTHCGWNSTLESVAKGVPMIAWPLFAEQRTNAVLLADDLRVALRVEDGSVVGREEIGRLVRRVMGEEEEGKELRNRVRKLSDAALLAVQEGGSSFRWLTEVVSYWKKICQEPVNELKNENV